MHDFRVMRGDQAQALFFGSQSTTSYRLSRLFQHSFLDRHFLPSIGGLASSPAVYTVGKYGIEMLRSRGATEKLRRRLTRKQLSPLFLEHTLQINDVRVAVTLAALTRGYVLEQWLDDLDLKADYDRVTIQPHTGVKREVSLIPDSYFVLQVPQGKARFSLAVDRGTMTVARFREKVLAYDVYVSSGMYQRHYQARSLRILTFTNSKEA